VITARRTEPRQAVAESPCGIHGGSPIDAPGHSDEPATKGHPTISAAEMLTARHQELGRRGIRFLIVRDVGQVRDVLDHSDLSLYLHPAVRDAIARLDNSPPIGD
jgi:hypothetical protein